MSTVDRTPFNIVPKKWAFDPEIGPFMRELLDVIWQLRTRTGGDFDLVEGNQPLTFGDMPQHSQSVMESPEAGLEGLELARLALQGAVPVGAIILWSGAVSDIPERWQICDGTNGTPNLTAKFVIHADADSGGTYDVGDNSATNITATIGGPSATIASSGSGPNTVASNAHIHTLSWSTRIPPHYALAYIQRISL
jgi:hypothetical protein